MIILGGSTSNRGLSFSRIRRRRGSKPDSGFSGLTFRLRPRFEFMEDRTLLASFLVINTVDSGPGSLRQAILDSNAATGETNTIDFSIGSGGVQTIAPLSPLPALTSPVTIDGTSQPGYDPNNPAPRIELSGQNINGTTAFGLEFSGGDSTIEGLIVNRFPSSQIVLDTKGGDIVRGNDLGTDATGRVALGDPINGAADLQNGLAVISSANTIGGTTPAARNVISGNGFNGIRIYSGASGNVVEGNYIGTDLTGTKALGNAYAGVTIAASASNNTIGGTAAGDCNVISGNAQAGVFIHDSATDNLVAGNYIGTDYTGTVALKNGLAGVEIAASASNNTIGGTAAGDCNVISGNAQAGVFIHDSATDNLVAGNYIGTDYTGTVALKNGLAGVEIAASASNNTIGGTAPRDCNVISATAQAAVFIHDSATDNLVAGNYIGTDYTGTVALKNGLAGVEIAASASNNTIGGTAAGDCNVISGNSGAGVFIHDSATDNLVAGNYIGTADTGTTALGNAYAGVEIRDSASNNTIGGTAAGDRNVISGGVEGGVFIHDSAGGNLVAGNYIGTDLTGTKALQNAYSGVEIADSASSNTIGGTAAGDRNVISGNDQDDGVLIDGSATDNLVAGNYIGTDVTGTMALGNAYAGVEIRDSASNNTIGGTAAGDRNVISGGVEGGVFIHDSAGGNLVAGNYIGTDLTGTKALQNAYSGVEIADSASSNTIGGTAAGDRNVISGNDQDDGVLIDGSATDNLVAGNYIGTDVTGTMALGNAYAGVEIRDSASNNTIGGTAAGDRNVISGGVEGGVFIHDSAGGNL